MIGLMAVAAISAFATIAADGISLVRKVKEGDASTFTLVANVDFNGMDVKVTGTSTEKVTKVDADGSYKVESKQTEMKVEVGGQTMDQPTPDAATTTTYLPNGEIKLIEGENTSADSYRTSNLGVFADPGKEIAIGDSWTHDIKKDEKTGAVTAKAEYKLLAEEKVKAWDTYKIQFKVAETEGSTPASSEGTIWVAKEDRSMVKTEAKWVNAPMPGAPAPINASVVIERTK